MRIYVEHVLCNLHFLGFFIFLPLQLGCIFTGPKKQFESPASAMWWAHMFLAIVTDTNAHVLLRFVFSFLFRYYVRRPPSSLLFHPPDYTRSRGPDFESVLLSVSFFFLSADHEIGNSLCWPSFPIKAASLSSLAIPPSHNGSKGEKKKGYIMPSKVAQ